MVLLPALNPACSLAIISLAWGLSLFNMTINMTLITEADSSVVLAELQGSLFRECNNQRLSPWGRPFSCSPDPVTDLCQNIYHGLPASLKNFCWYIINSGRLPLFSAMLLQSQLPHEGSSVDLLLGAGCSPVLHCLQNAHSCTVLSNIRSICCKSRFLQ